MTRLKELYEREGQSPWLDNLKRDYLTDGTLQRLVDDGIRGVTSNPTIFQKAISSGNAYDEQFTHLISAHSVEDAYWGMVIKDISDALTVLRPVYDASGGSDGFVSVEVAPSLAYDTEGTVKAARHLHDRIAQPNLMVKIPGTKEGLPAIQQMIAEGRSINVTLIFSLQRYADVIEAYIAGLERHDGDLSKIASVASFFISRVDTEVDRRLEQIGIEKALALRGSAAVANAVMAYQLFLERFSGDRWNALAERGAAVQRPLWASTSTKNPESDDLLYVNSLIGPNTVNTLPDPTIEAFASHGVVRRTIDDGVDAAKAVLDEIADVGVDIDDVTRVLEEEGVSSFSKSFDELMQALHDKSQTLKK
jgi:transaldolase